MKPRALFLILFCFLVSTVVADVVTYDGKNQFPTAKLDLGIDEYNRKVDVYNDAAAWKGVDGRKAREEYKAKIVELKEKIDEVQRIADAAKASRLSIEFPVAAQIPWGSTQKQVIGLLTKRGAVLSGQGPANVEFTGGEFAGEAVHRWDLKFINDQLCEVQIFFFNTAASMELFRHWNEVIATKYMIADRARQIYHEKGFSVYDSFRDLSDVKASKTASAANSMVVGAWLPSARWNFPNRNRIDVAVVTTDMVAVVYVNGSMQKEKSASDKASEKKDL